MIRSVLALLAASVLGLGMLSGVSEARPASPESGSVADVRAAAPAKIVRPASLTRIRGGYYFSAWGQDSKLVVKRVPRGLRFTDPRTARWEDLAGSCRRQRVRRGVAAVCRVPGWVSPANPLLLSMELRLGDDSVDTTTLGPEFKAYILADAGRDVIRLGAGDDFVNGAFHRDLIWGGPGDDFIRSGEANDVVYGQDGNDHLVGGKASDVLRGGDGNDLVEGGPGNDRMSGDAGADRLKCGDGTDTADVDPADTQRHSCERRPS